MRRSPRFCGFLAALGEMQLLPIIYYHYPNQTGLNFSPRQIADLLAQPGHRRHQGIDPRPGEVKKHITLCKG